jgi:predicted small lipoprotein YifL
MRRIVLTILIALALASALSACGKKGPLEAPRTEEERARR